MEFDYGKIKDLYENARLLPMLPGVYKMINKSGTVIYVGKSKLLRNRVSSYFQAPESHNYKTMKMVSEADRFECVYTSSEIEALVLENELIKLYTPKYNIKLKDDKSYPYLKLSLSDEYPRMTMVRSRGNKRKDKDLYFGPYSSTGAVYDIIETATKIFKIPSCKKRFPEDIGKSRPCLNYHIGKCDGVCCGKVTKEEYAQTISRLVSFLKNDYESTLKELRSEMLECSENLLFEKAGSIRDIIKSIENLGNNQKVIIDDKSDIDVFGTYFDEISGCISRLVIRKGRIIDSVRLLVAANEICDVNSFPAVFASFYNNFDRLPSRILVPLEFMSEDLSYALAFLSEKTDCRCELIAPQKGKFMSLIKLANDNAKQYCTHTRSIQNKNEEKLFALANLLKLEVVPERIESYDISNSGSEHTVAGMITVIGGKFAKKYYKLFNIRDVSQDDYSSMREAIKRRIEHYLENPDDESWKLPDLFLLDGGKGHVSTIVELLNELNINIPVIGMAKDDYHKTRTLVSLEGEISIANNTQIFNFIYGIQEEIHRFTFTAMDKKRNKSVKHLSLEKIPGIGPSKSKALFNHFGTITRIKSAAFEELVSVKSISKTDAEAILNFYKNKK